MSQLESLTWGSIALASHIVSETDYEFEAQADGTNLGNPAAILEPVRSLLTDGSLVVSQGFDNREVPIRLKVSSPRGIAGPTLAAAEAALMAEVLAESKSTLVWVPPAQDAATCVFDVVAARLERDTSDGWDFDEVRHECRYYLLTLTCLPFARAEEPVVVPALAPAPAVPDTVVIDAASSTTGWTAGATGSGSSFTGPTVVSDYIRVVASLAKTAYLNRAATFAMSGSPYLRISVGWVQPSGVAGKFFIEDSSGYGERFPIAQAISAPGVTDYYFDFTGIASVYEIQLSTAIPTGTDSIEIRCYEIARTDTLPAEGTRRQLSRTAVVAGSAPTQAAIRLFDATPAALGAEILAYSTRNPTAPTLRPHLSTSSTVTLDANRISGARNPLIAPMVFLIPASAFPEGTYALMGHIEVNAGADLTWSARMVDSTGATTIGSDVVATGTITLPTDPEYRTYNLGAISLPVVAAEGDQMIKLTLTGTSTMTVDEAWLFSLTDGALTWVRQPDVQWIEIRSPELGAARPSVYGGTGTAGEGGACIDYACESFGAHRFDPGLMQIFTVTSTSLMSQSEIEFYPRYHSHVEGSAA